MSYDSALEAAGAKILAYGSFGSYQGEWYAKVEYNGEVGWVEGSYGSCSGCDAFDAEFGYYWYDEDGSGEEKADYQLRLADFGKSYLDGLYSQEQQENKLEREIEDCSWGDYEEVLAFVKANR